MRPFVILSTPRSGSTYFVRYFGSHPDIYCQGELFIDVKQNFSLRALLNPNQRFKRTLNPTYQHFREYLRASKLRQLEYSLYKKRLTEKFIEQIFSYKYGRKAVGFKLMYSQNYSSLTNCLHKKKVSIVHLIRNNLLKIYISRKRMQLTKVAHSSQQVKPRKIVLNTDEILKKLTAIENEQNKNIEIFSKFERYYEVTYENFFDDQIYHKSKILSFLDIETDSSLSCDLKKISPDSLDQVIENYHEVKSILKGTRFINMLD